MTRTVRAVGLMSGTSLDGIDVALLETDGEALVRPGPALCVPYASEDRMMLRAALDEAQAWEPAAPMPEVLADAERVLTFAHVAAVHRFMSESGLAPEDIDVIGFHGQTVLHDPYRSRSVQIGLGDVLADLVKVDVVNDFRAADIAAGGHGAPLAPLYHAALVGAMRATTPICVVNIGGVGNLTWIAPGADLLAFDTGPGNALIDDWVMAHEGVPVDRGGALAGAGTVDQAVLARLLDNPFFAERPPKSLDRLSFSGAPASALSAADGAATLTAFTGAALARALDHLPAPPGRWIICGGGRHNPVLMADLRDRLPGEVVTAEDVGWQGDVLEAQAFAYLAVRSLRGLPLSVPGTTGVPAPQTGGHLNRARRGSSQKLSTAGL